MMTATANPAPILNNEYAMVEKSYYFYKILFKLHRKPLINNIFFLIIK